MLGAVSSLGGFRTPAAEHAAGEACTQGKHTQHGLPRSGRRGIPDRLPLRGRARDGSLLRFRVGTLDARAELATRSSFCDSGAVDYQRIAIVLDTLNRSLGSSESNGRGRRAVCWRPFDVYFAAAADSATQAAASRPGRFLLRSSVARARRPARLSIRSLLRPGVGRGGLRRFGERFRDELANGITTRLLRLGRK